MPLPDLPFYRQSKSMNTINLPADRAIRIDKGYFRLRFVDMRLARDFVFTSLLAPTLHAFLDTKNNNIGSREIIVAATTPPDAKGGDLRRVYIAPQSLTPVLPFDGNKIDARLGLFSIPIKDLAAEMLDLLGVLASPIQRPDLIAALSITNLLRQGVNALLGLDGANMLLGWQGEIGENEQIQQEYIVVTQSPTQFDSEKLTIKNGRLYVNGKTVDHINYMVFAIEVAERRSDWRILPEIKPYFDAWNNARSIYNLPVTEYNRTVSKLLGALRTSPNIVPHDAEHIVREEIRPLLEMGNEAQESLFRAAGFEADVLIAEQHGIANAMDDFVELDFDGIAN